MPTKCCIGCGRDTSNNHGFCDLCYTQDGDLYTAEAVDEESEVREITRDDEVRHEVQSRLLELTEG